MREASVCCSTHLCIPWLLLVCALTGDWTHNLNVSEHYNWVARPAQFSLFLHCQPFCTHTLHWLLDNRASSNGDDALRFEKFLFIPRCKTPLTPDPACYWNAHLRGVATVAVLWGSPEVQRRRGSRRQASSSKERTECENISHADRVAMEMRVRHREMVVGSSRAT